MNAWPSVKVGTIARQIRGVTYAKEDASGERRPGSVPLLRAMNITDDGLTFDELIHVPNTRVSRDQMLRPGDLVIAASSGSLDVVGKAAQVRGEAFAGTFGAFCKALRPSNAVEPSFFAHFFRTPSYRQRISSLAAGANINNLRNEHLDDLDFPLPPLPEQRRIAAILDQADALRAKRRAALAQLDEMARAIFVEMFGDVGANSKGWDDRLVLGDVADIASGITKGRKPPSGKLRSVPYLAVANVQDRALRLDKVKEIEVSEDEVRRYRLRKDDLVLTEGGDPDKLGRGVLWNDELPECIHQNHIFRVRLTNGAIDPVFLNWLVGSQRGKAYFLRSAKQTTGIASINMSQLRAFPMLMPPRSVQRAFVQRLGSLETTKDAVQRSADEFDALFTSLQHRAFRGDL